MGRKLTPGETSPFYPPRARWYAVIFYAGGAVRRRLWLDHVSLPTGMRPGEMLAGFLVPGLAVFFRGPRSWGRAAISACGLLLAIYVVWMGYPAANLAFGFLLSVHSTGFGYYCAPFLAREPFWTRVAVNMMVFLAMMLALYWPARNLAQERWLAPMRVDGRVFVVRRSAAPGAVRRGERVAYSLHPDGQGDAHRGGAVRMLAGTGLGPVLAVAGDHLVFSTNGYFLDGEFQKRLPHMPAAGEWTVPENHWFIWPDVAINGHGNVGEAVISSAMLSMADVSEKQFLGRPFRRWFWRKQF